MTPLTPISNTDAFLAEILKELKTLNKRIGVVETELQRLNTAAIQKPVIKLDIKNLASELQKQLKSK